MSQDEEFSSDASDEEFDFFQSYSFQNINEDTLEITSILTDDLYTGKRNRKMHYFFFMFYSI